MKTKVALLMVLVLALPVTASAQIGPPAKAYRGKGPVSRLCCNPGPHRSHFDRAMGHFEAARHGARGGPGIRHILMMGDELDLTDDQRDQLENMATDFQMEQIDRRAELKKVQIQLRKLVRDEKASEREVFRLIDEAARLKADMHKARYTHHRQVRTILDEEQIDKLKELHRGRFGDFDIEIIEDDDEDDDRREIRRKIIRKGGGY